MRSYLRLALVVCLLALVAAPASAALFNGQNVRVDYLVPDISSSFAGQLVLVGVGAELPLFPTGAEFLSLDISDHQLLITFSLTTPVNLDVFNGLRISDTQGVLADFTSVSLNGASTQTGFAGGALTFDADNIYINLAGMNVVLGRTLLFDVNPLSGPVGTPEPGTLVMVGLGIAAIYRWRQRS